MVEIGQIVWEVGGAFDWEKPVKVTAENKNEIEEFWNRWYFDGREAASLKTFMAHAEYGEYQARLISEESP